MFPGKYTIIRAVVIKLKQLQMQYDSLTRRALWWELDKGNLQLYERIQRLKKAITRFYTNLPIYEKKIQFPKIDSVYTAGFYKYTPDGREGGSPDYGSSYKAVLAEDSLWVRHDRIWKELKTETETVSFFLGRWDPCH